MNPVSTLVLALALLFGGAGAVFAFESGAQPDASSASVAAAADSTATTAAAPATRQGRRHHHRAVVRWAPCPEGTTLEDDTCVTDVVKTVTLPAPAAQAVSDGSSSSSGSTHSSGGDDRGDDHGGDDHGGDDHGGDHGEHDD